MDVRNRRLLIGHISDKMGKIVESKMRKKAKAYVLSVMQLLKPFVWYIGFYGFYFFWVMVDYFNPPAEDDPLFGSVATLDSWNYINREVYVESQKLGIFVDVLIFLLATSNIKNHPKIAKFIFLIPWIQACFNFIEEWLK